MLACMWMQGDDVFIGGDASPTTPTTLTNTFLTSWKISDGAATVTITYSCLAGDYFVPAAPSVLATCESPATCGAMNVYSDTATCTSPPPGTCVHATSTVTVLHPNGERRFLAVTELVKGAEVLAVGVDRKPAFVKVTGVGRSASAEGFVKVTMAGSKFAIMATPHHTFPTCGRAAGETTVEAKDLLPGNCLHTINGKGEVASVELVPIKEGDVTYTIELENADLLAVGGIFTHAKMMADLIKPNLAHTEVFNTKKSRAILKGITGKLSLEREKVI